MANTLTLLGAGSASSAAAPVFPSLSGLVLHLDASTLALSDGTAVASWLETSTNANTFAQATSGLRPTYKASVMGGKPAVRFTFGSSTIMTTATAYAVGSIYLVMQEQASQVNYFGVFGPGHDNGSNNAYFTAYNPPTAWDTADSGWLASTFEKDGVVTSTIDTTVGVPHIYGGSDASVRTTASGWSLGADRDNGRYFSGDIAEVIAYSRVLTSPEAVSVRAYLGGKYGISTV